MLLSPSGNINDEAVEAITWRVHELHLHFHRAALTALWWQWPATPRSSNPTLCIGCSCFCCATQGLTGALGSRFGRELPLNSTTQFARHRRMDEINLDAAFRPPVCCMRRFGLSQSPTLLRKWSLGNPTTIITVHSA